MTFFIELTYKGYRHPPQTLEPYAKWVSGIEVIGKLREHVFLMARVLILLLILFSGARNGTQGLTHTR